jgi:hypothetical protein
MLIGIAECHCVAHHCGTGLGGGENDVGLLVGPGVGSKTPTAGCNRESQSVGTHWEVGGGCIVEGQGWGV